MFQGGQLTPFAPMCGRPCLGAAGMNWQHQMNGLRPGVANRRQLHEKSENRGTCKRIAEKDDLRTRKDGKEEEDERGKMGYQCAQPSQHGKQADSAFADHCVRL